MLWILRRCIPRSIEEWILRRCIPRSIEEFGKFWIDVVSPPSSAEAPQGLMIVHPPSRDLSTGAQDGFLQEMKCRTVKDDIQGFVVASADVLVYKGRFCVAKDGELREEILKEAHYMPFTAHTGGTNMYRDLRSMFWWRRRKRDIANYVAKCLACQQVKAEHQRPFGMLCPLDIPELKWESLS
ncbi:hypothetical protein CASFOL_009082 [Castilleja foliolosa]|uniref:Integrase zinc-binding domain-containing protein n=1 Tax=Castilleja foliolosa TaxID=1961234 RepID=A0ABD3E4W0_9LAMI